MALLAEGILKTHWDQLVPVNVARIAKAMQLSVVLADPGEACALLEILPEHKGRVTLHRNHPITRQRYAVAHAIAHLSLHHLRPGMQRPIFVTDDYHVDHDKRHESEANDFALQLLIPEAVLRATLADGHVRTLDALAQLFAVSEQLIKQRMADLDLVLPTRLAQRLDPSVTWD